MDSSGRRLIVWTGATSGVGRLAVEHVLRGCVPVTAADGHHNYFHYSRHRRRSSSSSSISTTSTCSAGVHIILLVRDCLSDHAVAAIGRFRHLAAAAAAAAAATATVVIEPIECDLSSFAAVRKFATAVISMHGRVHTLVLGANISTWGQPTFTDSDKCELGLQVNHFSSWLLTALLAPVITGRVVFVSSVLYKTADLTAITLKACRKSGNAAACKWQSFSGVSFAATKAVQAFCMSQWVEWFRPRGVDVIMCTP
ncbi:hypothetical protein V1514DRAFT_267519, partial [Lipomyces japonicus]|uniref:uncharacterized protein n=1 Tax=Lipomyces japonicus TaxID=56871 RepID=UPI0034CE9FDE